MRYGMFYTPARQSFERNHNLVPLVDIEDYSLLLVPNGKASEDSDEVLQELTFEQLKQMPQHSVDVCFACAGNRRKFLMGEHPTIKGL